MFAEREREGELEIYRRDRQRRGRDSKRERERAKIQIKTAQKRTNQEALTIPIAGIKQHRAARGASRGPQRAAAAVKTLTVAILATFPRKQLRVGSAAFSIPKRQTPPHDQRGIVRQNKPPSPALNCTARAGRTRGRQIGRRVTNASAAAVRWYVGWQQRMHNIRVVGGTFFFSFLLRR